MIPLLSYTKSQTQTSAQIFNTPRSQLRVGNPEEKPSGRAATGLDQTARQLTNHSVAACGANAPAAVHSTTSPTAALTDRVSWLPVSSRGEPGAAVGTWLRAVFRSWRLAGGCAVGWPAQSAPFRQFALRCRIFGPSLTDKPEPSEEAGCQRSQGRLAKERQALQEWVLQLRQPMTAWG